MTNNGRVERLRFGVIGCADIAWRRTLPAMVANPAVELVAIASRDKRRAARFTDEFGGLPLEGYSAIVESADVDAVYLPLPLMMHAEWVERCLQAGKHVLVEKPMTSSYEQSRRLIEMARDKGLVLLENYMFLHHSQHATVRKVIADGVIGEVRGFAGWFTIPPKPVDDIRYQPAIGGGPFLDFGGYPVRAALHVLGRPLRTVGAVLRRDAELDVVMSGSILLTTDQGVPAQVTFGMEHSYRNEYCLTGSTGRLTLDWAFTPPYTHRPLMRIERQDHREELVLPADHQFANIIEAFVNIVLAGGDLRQEHDGTLEQAALMEQIQQAAVTVAV
jgi:NDP-hexose-3-ketoreductase